MSIVIVILCILSGLVFSVVGENPYSPTPKLDLAIATLFAIVAIWLTAREIIGMIRNKKISSETITSLLEALVILLMMSAGVTMFAFLWLPTPNELLGQICIGSVAGCMLCVFILHTRLTTKKETLRQQNIINEYSSID